MSDAQVPSLLATLFERLAAAENLEGEVKRARGGLPKELWPSVSAFANTQGGWIILGIREENDTFSTEGVSDPSTLLQQISDLLRNPNKISYPVCGAADLRVETVGQKKLIVLRVPAAPRRARPIFVNGNPYLGTYVRRNSGDYHCSKPEVDRMMREASDVAADSMILPHFGWDDLDPGTFARYRRRYQTLNPGSPWNSYDDRAFLRAVNGVSAQ